MKKRLRPWAPPVTETVDLQFLKRVIDTVPHQGGGTSRKTPALHRTGARNWRSPTIAATLTRIKGSARTPGPDGIHAKVWARADPIGKEAFRDAFTKCLREGTFSKR